MSEHEVNDVEFRRMTVDSTPSGWNVKLLTNCQIFVEESMNIWQFDIQATISHTVDYPICGSSAARISAADQGYCPSESGPEQLLGHAEPRTDQRCC